ncbi:hypothetical protein Tco_1217239 [Tanacetum coccineum]
MKTPMSSDTQLTKDEECEFVNSMKYRDMIGLWYPKGTGTETVVYADSDHVKQTVLARSTTEAEYVSAKKACQQALWMKQALIDYDIRLNDVPIMCDNKAAIDLSKNPVQYSRMKHIEIRHHFLRDNVQKENISIEKVSSEDNIADILTKPLKRDSFNYLRMDTPYLSCWIRRIEVSEQFLQMSSFELQIACLLANLHQSLDKLALGVPSEGRYQTDRPSPDEIKAYVQLNREEPPTRVHHGRTIYVEENQILTQEVPTNMKTWVQIIRENVFCLGSNRDHIPAYLCHMLYCIATFTRYNLAFFILKRMEFVRCQPRMIIPYEMLLNRLFNHVMFIFPELSSNRYVLCDRVMYHLAPQHERKTRRDYGTKRGRHSTSASSPSAFDYPSSSHHVDDDNDQDDEAKSSSSSSLNAPSKTPTTKETSSTLGTTSFSFESKPNSLLFSLRNTPSPQPTNPFLDDPLDAPSRPSNPFPLQSHPFLDITLSLSPITPLDHMFETPSPPLPPPPPQPPLMGHLIFFNILDYHGAHCTGGLDLACPIIRLSSQYEIHQTDAHQESKYIALIPDDIKPGIVKPKIDDDVEFEINANFMRELRRKLFVGTDDEDAYEHVRTVLEIVDLFNFPGVTHDAIMLRKVHIFYIRLDISTRKILDSNGFIPLMTPTQALESIQVMTGHSHDWYDETTTRERINDVLDNVDAIHESFEGEHPTKEHPLKKEDEAIKHSRYMESLEEIVIKFCENTIKKHTADDERMRKILENTESNIKALKTTTKNLQEKAYQLTHKVLTNTREKVKAITTMGKKNMKEPVPRDLSPTPFLGHLKEQMGSPYRTRETVCIIRNHEEIHNAKAQEKEGDMDVGWDITSKDVERLRQFLAPTIHTLPNLELVVQPYIPLGPVHDKDNIEREKE